MSKTFTLPALTLSTLALAAGLGLTSAAHAAGQAPNALVVDKVQEVDTYVVVPVHMTRDAALASQVRQALTSDTSLDARDIQVESRNGRIHLTGWAGQPSSVQDAMHTAAAVPGVTHVDAFIRTWSATDEY